MLQAHDGLLLCAPQRERPLPGGVLDARLRHDGTEYRALSKLASAITGQPSDNGFLWTRLTEPKETQPTTTLPRRRSKMTVPAEATAEPAPQQEVARTEERRAALAPDREPHAA